MMTSREFNQDVSKAKRMADDGPVYITDRGKPAHVLLSISEYEQLKKPEKSFLEALSCPALADIDIESFIPERTIDSKPFEFEG